MSSRLGDLYQCAYGLVAGKHPYQRLWHFQWLPIKDLRRDLRRILPRLTGDVLDVGCGQQPYRAWMRSDIRYRGADLIGTDAVADIWLDPRAEWPISSASVDAIVCTQVLEHVYDADLVLSEMARVLRPGGTLILSVPFIYSAHGLPHDYRRLSKEGVVALLAPLFDVIEIKEQGGVGSSIGTLLLNWLDHMMSGTFPRRMIKGLMLPLWIPFCAVVNIIGAVVDWLDTTRAFYGNVFAVAHRRL